MKALRVFITVSFLILLAFTATSTVAGSERDQDLLNQGKVLIFDKKWDQAYLVFQRFTTEFPKSPLLAQAYFLGARCLQLQGKEVDAIRAYELFLQKFPNEKVLDAESTNYIIELSASQLEKGSAAFKDRMRAGLKSPNKDIRYYAALRCSRIKDLAVASLAVPVLREIVQQEKEADLVKRAEIALLRIDPKTLASAPVVQSTARKPAAAPVTGQPRMLRLQIIQSGGTIPAVDLNIPFSFAQMAVAALDESAKTEMRRRGIDVANIIRDLERMGPAKMLTIRDGDKTVQLWIQ
jgi:outer membrane protein assembly factor BamD (BamD/ComL family)